MNRARIEIKLIATVHVGEDVQEEGASPARPADLTEMVSVVRTVQMGTHVMARDAIAGHFVNAVANMLPTASQRVKDTLREKGF